MCACIPTLKPIVASVFPRLLSVTRSKITGANSNPFEPSSHSRAYYGRHDRNDSTIDLSQTVVASGEREGDETSSDQINFDTVTKEPGIHVKQEWSVTEREDAESGNLGWAM
jgi:hypothetical protein